MPSRAVLYLEDSAADAALARRVLEKAGIRVEIVTTPGQCLDALWRDRYAALLIDHVLERFEGADLISSFRNLGIDLPPTYLVSGSKDLDLPQRARDNGAEGFISKGNIAYASELLDAVSQERSS